MARKQPLTTPALGRRSTLTPEVAKSLCDLLSAGNYQETACQVVGVGKSTYYEWLARGRAEIEHREAGTEPDAEEQPYVDLVLEVEKARGQAEARMLTVIQKAAVEGQWQAAGWFLERTNPQRFGRFTRTEISGPEGSPIEVSSVDALDAALSSLLDAPTQADA